MSLESRSMNHEKGNETQKENEMKKTIIIDQRYVRRLIFRLRKIRDLVN